MKAEDVVRGLAVHAKPEYAESLQWFFKTGKGQYGEGDKFIGVRMPSIRLVCKHFKDLPLEEIQKLYDSPIHEHRMAAGTLLTYKFPNSDVLTKQQIYEFYLKNVRNGRINNWDLIDLSAPRIVGAYLTDKPQGILIELAKDADNVWCRRVAVLACFKFIDQGDPATALMIADMLLHDKHDLIRKAVGWMLREIGKRVDRKILIDFLDQHASKMPRVTLRYAIEHLPKDQRQYYLSLKGLK